MNVEKQVQKMQKALLDMALDGVKQIPDRRQGFRKRFIEEVGGIIDVASMDLMAAAMCNESLTATQRMKLNLVANTGHLYMMAILKLLEHGNAQWDEPDLLIGQFNHQLRSLVTNCKAIEVELTSEEKPDERNRNHDGQGPGEGSV